MKVAIIVGSHRAESQSSKVGHYIADELKNQVTRPMFLTSGRILFLSGTNRFGPEMKAGRAFGGQSLRS